MALDVAAVSNCPKGFQMVNLNYLQAALQKGVQGASDQHGSLLNSI